MIKEDEIEVPNLGRRRIGRNTTFPLLCPVLCRVLQREVNVITAQSQICNNSFNYKPQLESTAKEKKKHAENLIGDSQLGLSFETAIEEDARDEEDDGLERRKREMLALSKRSARTRSWRWIWALELDSSVRMKASHEEGEARNWTKPAYLESPSHERHTPQVSSFLASS